MSPVATQSLAHLCTVPADRPALRAMRVVLRVVTGFVRAVTNRRDVKRLLELDDRALKDIGLVRGDVLGALAVPVTRDPSVLLRLRTVERRALRRGHAPPARRVTRTPCDA